MLIKVENRGITNDGYADMSVIIEKGKHNIPTEVYYLSVLNALQDTDKQAFLKALDAFFKQELEHINEE